MGTARSGPRRVEAVERAPLPIPPGRPWLPLGSACMDPLGRWGGGEPEPPRVGAADLGVAGRSCGPGVRVSRGVSPATPGKAPGGRAPPIGQGRPGGASGRSA
jgi:hypothetical protein